MLLMSSVIPALTRQVDPIDIGEPPSHLTGQGLANFHATRVNKLTGKQYLTYAVQFFNGISDYYPAGAYFFHTTTNVSGERYVSSGINMGVFTSENIRESMLRHIYTFVTDEEDPNNLLHKFVHIQECYDSDPQLRYSGPIDSSWVYSIERVGDGRQVRLTLQTNLSFEPIFGNVTFIFN